MLDLFDDESTPYINVVAKCLPAIILVSLIFLLWKMVSQGTSNQSRKPENAKDIPGGPRGLPIIGNAHQLGPDPHKHLLNLAQRYGDVFRMQLGSHPVVVLSRRTAIHEALINQTIEFAGRPEFPGFHAVLSVRGGGIGFISYDEGWNIHREMVNKAFLDFSDGNQVGVLESLVTSEVTEFLKFVLKGKESCNFEPKNVLRIAVLNIMTNLLFQIRRDYDHPELQNIMDRNNRSLEAAASGNIVNFLPCLKRLLSGKLRKIESANQESKTLIDVYVNETLQHYQPESKGNILHYLITLFKDINNETRERLQLTDGKIQAAVYDLFGAGYETVSTSLMWAFLYLVKFPHIQKEIQNEIDNVVGRERLPSVADRDNLPMTEAFIAEVFRHVSIVPLVVPHKTTQDTVLGGGYNYFIPKDTIVFMNLYSIHNDPQQWVDPDIFNPKRFLTEDGSGLDKTKVSSVMQLGGGCRRCVGFNIAPIQLFLYISICLHQCSLKSVDGQQLSLNGTTTPITIQPQNYEVTLERR